MLIFVSKDIDSKAADKLNTFGDVIAFGTENLVYNAIKNHPDIFLCQIDENLVVAPNIPENFIEILKEKKINFSIGTENVGFKYPQTALYNVVANEKFLICNQKYTDKHILELSDNITKIHVNQGYVRCNLISINSQNYITSDKGIEKTLKSRGLNVLFVNPQNIKLKDNYNGFFGGCCAIFNDIFFINGNLKYIENHIEITDFINNLGFNILELSNEPPFDIGSIFFVK